MHKVSSAQWLIISFSGKRTFFAILRGGRGVREHIEVVRISNCCQGMEDELNARLCEGPVEVRGHKSVPIAL